MKGRIFVCSVVVLIISVFLASIALAKQCDEPGKVMVTIVTQAGQVIEICVSEKAIPYIGGESDVVIPASCPCWTSESIERLCGDIPLIFQDPCCDEDERLVVAGVGNCDSEGNIAGAFLAVGFTQYPPSNYACGIVGLSPASTSCDHQVDYLSMHISFEQAQACRAILINSELWARNCDGP